LEVGNRPVRHRKRPKTSGSSAWTPRKRKPKLLKDGSVPEKVIQKQILDWLKETGLVHWRQNSGTVFAGHRRIFLGDDGLPDIVCVIPPGGKLCGLEVKSAKGRLRPGQIAFRDRLLATGGSYHVVRTLQQAMQAIAKELGKGHAWTHPQLLHLEGSAYVLS